MLVPVPCMPGAAAVKPAAARALASLLRGCKRERARTDLYCRVMRELAWGRSCFARLAFTQVSYSGQLCVMLTPHLVGLVGVRFLPAGCKCCCGT